jgi:hypothetical protein
VIERVAVLLLERKTLQADEIDSAVAVGAGDAGKRP